MRLIVILALTVVVTAALIYGSHRWESATKEMQTKLEAARVRTGIKTFSADELIGLPVPVQRYFRAVLKEGQPIVSAVHIEHGGTFDVSGTGEQWKPFTSRQRIIAQRPGFDW